MAVNDQYLIPGLFPFSRLCGNPGPYPKKGEFWPFDPIHRVGRGSGVCGQNIYYHAAAFGDSLYFDTRSTMTIFWKSWNLTYWPHLQGSGRGLLAKYLLRNECTMLLNLMIPSNLICNITIFWKSCSEKWQMFSKSWILTYWPHSHGQGGGVTRVEGGGR